MEPLNVYLRLVGAQLRAQMQYKVSFSLSLLGSFLVNIVEFGAILVLFTRIPALAGWSLPEIALLYGMSGTAFATAELFASALDDFQLHIVRGTFDRVLVRPRGALMQVITEDVALRRIGRVAQGLVVLWLAIELLDVQWTLDRVALLVMGIASGTIIYFTIFVLGAVFCFFSVQAKEATHVFTYGGDALASYPLDIYTNAVRRFFTFIVPLAFVSYEPALYVLGRPDPLGLPDLVRMLSPLAALAMVALARLGWHYGVRHYQSTGS
ncbi:MAG: ABC-2 family transporter protein [Chloroflexi bacterium]|nr:ABC-2 family transporter protein [Chloroflexota bacterium]MBV9545033.1 ABC-2 family transporter protein [Chloroflexota bacterium]